MPYPCRYIEEDVFKGCFLKWKLNIKMALLTLKP